MLHLEGTPLSNFCIFTFNCSFTVLIKITIEFGSMTYGPPCNILYIYSYEYIYIIYYIYSYEYVTRHLLHISCLLCFVMFTCKTGIQMQINVHSEQTIREQTAYNRSLQLLLYRFVIIVILYKKIYIKYM